MKDELKMGLRSILYRHKQYLSLFLVCMFGVGVSLFCLFSVRGMLSALEDKARIYYGGDLQFIGGWGLDQPVSNTELLVPFFPEDAVIAERFDFNAEYAALFFEGTGVRQRVIKGVNFEKEKKLFANFNYIEGSAEGVYGTNGILLSEPIAKMLEVHVGDEVTFMLRNSSWQINTIPVIVKGIFRDSSLFGMYTSYMDIKLLSDAYGYSTDYCNRICIMLPDGSPNKKDIEMYQNNEVGTVQILYTKFVNTMSFRPEFDVLVPFTLDETQKRNDHVETLFEPGPEEILDNLIPMMVTNVAYSNWMESTTSEQGSRRVAMKTASDNADDLVSTLQLEYNKARQASITQEITEIVSGSNAV